MTGSIRGLASNALTTSMRTVREAPAQPLRGASKDSDRCWAADCSEALANDSQASHEHCYAVYSMMVARLVAADHTGRSGACAVQRNCEARPTCEAPTGGDGQDDRHPSQLVERCRGYNQYRLGSPLFMAGSGIKAGNARKLVTSRVGTSAG